MWKRIQLAQEFNIPSRRSGHTTDVFDNYLVLFGGIEDVTKELNDLWIFSFKTSEWIQFQEGD